ncbi:hypothetical protein G6L37_02810 [Agrobacterium rubi]|nr:hypothetical protein [Agrobacterium rubi]NTF24312.1 hypothetical protein [Agrobacterium rubi]
MPEQQAPDKQKGSLKERAKAEAKAIIRDDLVGVKDWQSSKMGAITGFSTIGRAIGTIGNSVQQSSQRMSMVIGAVTASPNLPDVPEEGTPEDRFQLGMRIYGLNETNVAVAIRNTYWSAILYLALSTIGIGTWVVSLWFWPAKDMFLAITRMSILPFLLALLLRSCFTNWMFRSRQIGVGIGAYLGSGSIFPRRE